MYIAACIRVHNAKSQINRITVKDTLRNDRHEREGEGERESEERTHRHTQDPGSGGSGYTSVPICGLRVFICSRMKPMVCWRILLMCSWSCCTLALASASLACSSVFSAERASRAWGGVGVRVQIADTHPIVRNGMYTDV